MQLALIEMAAFLCREHDFFKISTLRTNVSVQLKKSTDITRKNFFQRFGVMVIYLQNFAVSSNFSLNFAIVAFSQSSVKRTQLWRVRLMRQKY